jgi:L-ribulose-5-phosphate 3-epimerase
MDAAMGDDGGVSRREFLAAGAAAAAGMALAGAVPRARAQEASGAARRAPLKLAVKYGMIGQGATVLERFELLRRLGYDGVELDSPGGPPAAEVVEASKQTGIEVPGVVNSVHWSKPLSDASDAVRAEGRAALEAAIRDCREYGGTSVLLVPAVVNKRTAYGDAYRRSQEEIRKVLPLAEELGITISIENVWNNFLLSPLEAARYIDELESPNIAWHFDPGNVVNFGWPEDWARTLGRRIVRLDVKEFSRKKRDEEGLWKGFGVEIGEGDCDWPAVMRALAEVGYSGWACAEVAGGDEARLADILVRMRRALEWPE